MKLRFDESLRDYFPAEVEVEASSAFDALSLIATQHPLNGKIEPIPMRFKEFMSYEIATDPSLSNKVFTLTRVDNLAEIRGYRGAGGGRGKAVAMIVVAIALIVITHGAAAESSTAAATSSIFTTAVGQTTTTLILNGLIMNIGVQLLIAGLMGLMSPTKREDKTDKKSTYSVGTGLNTTEIGTAIQFILGRHMASAQILSFNISTNSSFNGIDDPDGSPYFKSKSDTNLPTINNDKFYGLIRAGDTTKILHQNNELNRTGTELQ